MTIARIEAGTLAANREDRTVTGLLLKFGEMGRTNLGKFTVRKGAFKLPKDVQSFLHLANTHERPIKTVGTALFAQETDEGILATWRINDGPEGDALLAAWDDPNSGAPRKLSIEVDDVVLRGGVAVGGTVHGAAVVDRGAFPSSSLLAADVGDGEDVEPLEPDDPEAETSEASEVNPDGSVTTKVTTTKTETDADGVVTKTETVTTVTSEQPETLAEEEEPTVGNATVPSTLAASAKTERVDKATLLSTISAAVKTQDSSLMAALSDVKISGTGAVGTGVVVPDYVGEIWSGRAFQRRVIPLISSGTLTSLSTTGWRFVTPPQVDEWAGNKAQIPSNTPTTESVSWGITRFAGGWDIAREFIDFGETAVIDSFLKLAADSYAKKSDAKVLTDLVAGATSGTVGTIPDGVGNAMAKIVRGALRVISADALPAFALVAPDVVEELVFTKKDGVLAYLSMSLGLEEGSLDTFKIVPHPGMVAGTVLVGAKEAAGAYELAGSPIRVNALDIAKGGVDEALFGYIQTRIEYPTGLQLITPNA